VATTPQTLDLDALRALLERGDGSDRAFVDSMVRMEWSRTRAADRRAELEELHRVVEGASSSSHAALRAAISKGTARGVALRERFDQVPLFERDHFVEEVLGIAYPPLEEAALAPELTAYAPSGYDEIAHAFDITQLAPGDRFVDLGSGMGKAVMLAELLTGATSTGVELVGSLHDLAESASRGLGLREARFHHADARDVAIGDPDVVFMYLPFTGQVLATVLGRLMESGRTGAPRPRRRFLCAGALDTNRYPDLVAAGPPRSWLQVYAWR
jgi:protein-L-isoaspartate O-methyltransferase